MNIAPESNEAGLKRLQATAAAAEVISDFLYVFDLEGRFTYANNALCTLLGIEPEQIVGLNFHDLAYPEQLASTLQAQIQEVIDTRGTVRAETFFESAAGNGYYEYIFVPILGSVQEVVGVAGTTRDITDRKRAEDALLASQKELDAERRKLRNLIEQAPAFIAILHGPDFTFEFANEDYFELIGRRDVIGMTVQEALPEVVEQGYIELLKSVYSTGKPYIGRSQSLVFDAGEGQEDQRYLDFIYQAIKNADGEIDSILVHGVDVTDQVIARQEIERLNADLESSVEQRTSELQLAIQDLEGFTYSVSHDLRAPLRAIISSSQILLADHREKLDSEAIHELVRQSAAASKLAVLIDDLLKFSRLSRKEIQKQHLDLSALAEQIASDLSLRMNVDTCDFHIARGMSVFADPVSAHLLLLNLMENACKFSPDVRFVEVGQTETEEGRVFWVRDRGIGFDEKYAHKLFLPFERLVTDSQFPGTGIGLANVKRIVEQHGGRVWAESKPGQGATFFFTLGSE